MNHMAFLSEEAIKREKKTKKAEKLLDISCTYYTENEELLSSVDKDKKGVEI